MSKFNEKLVSGKFFATVFIIGTYCIVILACAIATAIGKCSAQTFLGLFAGFSTLAGTIVTAYFNKKSGGDDVKSLAIFIMAVAALSFVFAPLSFADEVITEPQLTANNAAVSLLSSEDVTLKQAVIYPFKDKDLQNVTAVTVAETEKVESWGKWNALWDGWVLDAGLAYDSTNLNGGSIMLGRVVGTLGNYIPINFPLKDKIKVTIYPIGLFVDDIFNSPKSQLCAGGAYIGASIKF